ncbi:MAG: hypothetical protein EB034_09070, partial [Verrucomicrobia bacterium]|nr:hypothetical protein [Verrucomicrobiota bacterium]
VIENAAREFSPHLVAFYLRELAAQFHSYYNGTRMLVEDEKTKLARLALDTPRRLAVVGKTKNLSYLGFSSPANALPGFSGVSSAESCGVVASRPPSSCATRGRNR